ncbi:hypothetical protein C5167_041082 [Papaver somniferum]|uniref:Knottin scorpion toxin-like domain-containing protein n=1 Tax=Papaver somniferum TaxID=3469 RepID=A0A4Y7IKZ7_PAPSO|nr:uncharacterized protein LOC113339587 [Papaver somniferum]RZC48139.1 hypothetical protein C5167_041082 [Papaver somniferum]
MAKSCYLVINFFFVVSVVLQSAYVSAADPPSGYGLCNADQRVETGNFSSCERCHAVCKSSSECISESTNTRAYICNCCVKIKGHPSGTGATTTTTSFALLSCFLIFSFMLNNLFI